MTNTGRNKQSINDERRGKMKTKEKEAYVTNETIISAEFFDVDAMNVVWHGNYVKYMEIARCALLDKIGYGYKEMVKEGFAYPVTSINLKYVRSLYFGDKAKVKTYLTEYENCIKIKYEIYNEKGELCTKAESTQMAVNLATQESRFECTPWFIQRVEKILKEEGRL